MRSIFLILILFTSIVANAQGWVYSKEFGTDMWTGPVDHDVDIVDCNTGKRDVWNISICMRKDYESMHITDLNKMLDGLEGKVARGIEAQRPKRKSTSSSGSYKYGTGTRRAGTSYSNVTSEENRIWRAERQAQRIAAQRREQERKRQEAIRKKIADDNRAAAVTASTNARLQGATNRRIQNDYYHANEGARLAQQQARQAHKTTGPQFKKPQMSNTNKARMLRGQNKPRRIMYPQRQPQNTSRKMLAQVERKPQASPRDSMLQRALKIRAELNRRKAAANKEIAYKGIKLSDKSVSTLGQDWKSTDFQTGPLAPPPLTKVATYKEPKWLTREKNMREMLGDPPLTQEEERMKLILDEFLE